MKKVPKQVVKFPKRKLIPEEQLERIVSNLVIGEATKYIENEFDLIKKRKKENVNNISKEISREYRLEYDTASWLVNQMNEYLMLAARIEVETHVLEMIAREVPEVLDDIYKRLEDIKD